MKAHANQIFKAMPLLIDRKHSLSLASLRSLEYTLTTGLYKDEAAELRNAINALQSSDTDDSFETAIAHAESAIARLYFSEDKHESEKRREYFATIQ